MSARSWSAPVLWRFGNDCQFDGSERFVEATPCSEAKAVEDNRRLFRCPFFGPDFPAHSPV